jgi:phage gp36-like protein
MYATQSDLEKRIAPQTLVELADDNGDGLADTAVVDAALEDADAEIDLFLGARFATPIAAPPDILTRLAADLAIHALFARMRLAVSAEHAERYAEAVRLLGEIASGRLSLETVSGRDLPESTRRDVDKTFSTDSLEEF